MADCSEGFNECSFICFVYFRLFGILERERERESGGGRARERERARRGGTERHYSSGGSETIIFDLKVPRHCPLVLLIRVRLEFRVNLGYLVQFGVRWVTPELTVNQCVREGNLSNCTVRTASWKLCSCWKQNCVTRQYSPASPFLAVSPINLGHRITEGHFKGKNTKGL
jgi:hypothetical protein